MVSYGEVTITNLAEPFSAILSNDSQSFSTDSSRVASAQSYYTDVIVYQGTTKRTDFSIGTINSASGITVSKSGSRITFSTTGNTKLTADSGKFDIPITLDGITITKTFT